MREGAPRRLRVFYAAGPGDVIGTYRHWVRGQDDPAEPSVAYSGQFYDVCRAHGAAALVVTACPRRDTLRAGALRIVQRPYRLRTARGAWFHLGQLWNGLRLVCAAVRFRADLAIIAEGSHWFVFALLRLAGVRVVPALHNLLNVPRRGPALRRIAGLNRWFFRRHTYAVLSASAAITRELGAWRGAVGSPVIEFLPLYRRRTFAALPAADWRTRPFRILFIGRIEPEKGVFDLLDVARRLLAAGHDIRVDFCGDGSVLPELRQRVAVLGLADRVACHGPCAQIGVRRLLAACQLVVVPTRAAIGEGFNMVTAEAILAGRPVVTSRVCAALDYVRPAVIEVPPDDVAGYCRAIADLLADPGLYARKAQACAALQAQLYDAALSFGAALERVIAATGAGALPADFVVPIPATASATSARPVPIG
jgi:glycogen synthase